jgi:hypothetical protein
MRIIQIRVKECNISNRPKTKQCDYVDMPSRLIEVDDRVEEINIENISNIEGEDMATD